jgi:hypothetical protein
MNDNVTICGCIVLDEYIDGGRLHPMCPCCGMMFYRRDLTHMPPHPHVTRFGDGTVPK